MRPQGPAPERRRTLIRPRQFPVVTWYVARESRTEQLQLRVPPAVLVRGVSMKVVLNSVRKQWWVLVVLCLAELLVWILFVQDVSNLVLRLRFDFLRMEVRPLSPYLMTPPYSTPCG